MQRDFNNYLLDNDIYLRWTDYFLLLFIIEQEYITPVDPKTLRRDFACKQKIPCNRVSLANLKNKGFVEEEESGIVAGPELKKLIDEINS